MATKKLLIANWKLNHTKESAGQYLAKLKSGFRGHDHLELAISPVVTLLDFCSTELLGSPVLLAAQNVFYENSGAFTGEWSAKNLIELKVNFCIIGHSERRQIFGETNEVIAKKARACQKSGVIPVICVGESQAQRDRGETAQVIEGQVEQALSLLDKNTLGEIIIAYEPIWAIGTGKSASKEEAQWAHEIIREILRKNLGAGGAQNTRILYGGSVNPQNIREIVSMSDVDGALVGGASLQVETFLSMVKELVNLFSLQR